MTPSGKDWIFVSDAHFTGRDSDEMETFLRFLDAEEERMGHLVILGDLFEFFFGFKRFFSKKNLSPFSDYLPVLERLQRLYRQGVEIDYFEGNHDFFLQSFFSDHFGMKIDVHPEGMEELIERKRAYIAHGDLSNPDQWAYRIFRRTLKNRWTYMLIRFSGPRLSRWVAQRLNEMSYQRYHHELSKSPHPAFKGFASRKFSEGFEVVILGHSHFPEKAEEWVDGRRCLYFNVGDWMTHRSFLRFTPPEQFQLCNFKEES